MASSLALKRLVSCSNIIPKSLLPTRQAQSAYRLFNTNAVREFDEDGDRSLDDVDRRSNLSAFRRGEFAPNSFSDVFDPFSSTRSLSQILNMMDNFTNSPLVAASRGIGAGLRRGFDARETDDGLYLQMDMPGLGKENVKISVEQNTLIIKGESEGKETGDEESGRRYSSRIDLPEKLYKPDQIKAEMKNGVLKIVVPKVKEDERSDVFHVEVE